MITSFVLPSSSPLDDMMRKMEHSNDAKVEGAEADEGKPQEAVAVEVEDAHDEGNHQRHPGFKRRDGKRDIGM